MNQSKMNSIVLGLPSEAEQHRIVAKVDELMALCDQLETQHNNATEAHEKLVSHLLGTLTHIPVRVSARPELVTSVRGEPVFSVRGEPVVSVRGEPVVSVRGEPVEPRPSTVRQAHSSERTEVTCSPQSEFEDNWQRIAAHFDTLFTTESSINALKQTLLQLAVMGKLAPQNPNDEPASELLKRIQAEKTKLVADGKIKKDKPLPPITDGEKPFELPDGWEWARMIDCAKQITDGEHLTPQRTLDSTRIPLVTAKNVRDGNMDYANTDYVDIDVADKCWNRCKPELNDILIVSVGATIGRLTIIDDHRDMVIVRSVTLVKPLLINIPYLALGLRSPYLQTRIWSGVKQNAQPCLYLSVSNSLPIPIPPLAEQRRIVTKVDELMALCDQLKSRITESNQLQQKLADVMVEQAVA